MNDNKITENSKVLEFVSLTAGEQGYCVEITSILEIRRWTNVTSLPNSDASVLGVMNLRGAVIPIIDLGLRLGLGVSKIGSRNVVVVASIGTRIVGLLVDAVSEILSVESESIRPNPTHNRDGSANQIVGLLSVEDKMLRVLDLNALFSSESEEAA